MDTAAYDRLLPPDISIKSTFWFGRSRSYPIFSPLWFRYRSLSALSILLTLALIFIAALGVANKVSLEARCAFILLAFAPYVCSCLLGPWLAMLVRARRESARRELAGLVIALVIGFAVSEGLKSATHYYSKQSGLSAQVENGVTDPAKKGTAKPTEESASARTFGQLVDLGIFIWTGSAIDLLFFLRQRRRLVAALREHELVKAREARNEAELRLAILAAQIEPHFLFNSLAGVRSAISVDPVRATAIVDHLVDYLRATIPQMRSDGTSNQSSLDSQLEAARAYLSLMQARIPRLSFAIHVDPQLKGAALPPLMLISLVENAVKHGIEPKIGAANIEVSARVAGQEDARTLEVSVCDDGVGFGGTTSGTGIGIANITERLEQLYGDQAKLTLTARAGGGVQASIRLPLTQLTN
ncbi:MAG: histidine kinase [Pseudomonadota bacterium]